MFFLMNSITHSKSCLRAPPQGRQRGTSAHGASYSYFGVQFSASAFWPSNLGLFERIPLNGCAWEKITRHKDKSRHKDKEKSENWKIYKHLYKTEGVCANDYLQAARSAKNRTNIKTQMMFNAWKSSFFKGDDKNSFHQDSSPIICVNEFSRSDLGRATKLYR